MGDYAVIFIRQGDRYESLVRDLGDDLLQRRLLPFVGAGVSHAEPSRLAMSPQLAEPLRDAMREAASLIPSLPTAWGVPGDHLKAAPLERLLDVLQRTHGKTAITYLSVLNGDIWNTNHSRLASFAQAGLLPTLVTLNFDLLFEKALAAYDCSSRTVCPLIDKEFSYGAGPQVLTIIKPHASFSPDVSDPFEHLSATMSEVGTQPSPLNSKVLTEALQPEHSLLVAGYSDNDWDIFPILAHLVPKTSKRVVWVKHAECDETSGKYLLGWELDRGLQERVIPWLRDEVTSAILLVGDVREFLEDIAKHVNNTIQPPLKFLEPMKKEKAPIPPEPDSEPFRPGASPVDNRTLRTLISLAMLIGNTGPFADSLLEHLRDELRDACPLEVAWKLEETLSNFEHTRGAMRRSIVHMRRVIAMKGLMQNTSPDDHDFVWLGYKYLGRVKRREPDEGLFSWLLRFPFNLARGLRYMRQGSRLSQSLKAGHGLRVATANDMARYYLIDLLHTWSSVFLLAGSKVQFLYRLPFWGVTRLYDRLAERTELMDRQYYYLRHLEARLFAGIKIMDIEKVRMKLDDLERSYRLTQNDVQIGNTFAYRALIAMLIDHDRDTARQQLRQAEEEWKRGGRLMASGKRRVKLFRRFIR